MDDSLFGLITAIVIFVPLLTLFLWNHHRLSKRIKNSEKFKIPDVNTKIRLLYAAILSVVAVSYILFTLITSNDQGWGTFVNLIMFWPIVAIGIGVLIPTFDRYLTKFQERPILKRKFLQWLIPLTVINAFLIIVMR